MHAIVRICFYAPKEPRLWVGACSGESPESRARYFRITNVSFITASTPLNVPELTFKPPLHSQNSSPVIHGPQSSPYPMASDPPSQSPQPKAWPAKPLKVLGALEYWSVLGNRRISNIRVPYSLQSYILLIYLKIMCGQIFRPRYPPAL